jgi:hypothetical protein
MGGSQVFYDDGGAINGGWEKFSFTGLRWNTWWWRRQVQPCCVVLLQLLMADTPDMNVVLLAT